jgi:hypothetical protein
MDTFNIEWNNFKINTENAFTNLLDNALFVDVTLVSDDGQSFKAHKVVIAACSDLFRNILENTDHSSPLIYLHGIQHQVLKYVLDFMYKGKAEVPEKNLPDFMKVAHELKLKGLTFDEGVSEISDSATKVNKKAKTELTQSWSENQVILNGVEKDEVENVKEDGEKDAKETEESDDDEIYMNMIQLKADQELQTIVSSRKKEIKIARYQNSLKDFETYKKNFNKKQMDETTTENKSCGSICCDKYECDVCGFATKFEEILERHQLRHQLVDLQNSGFNISKENFTLPF